MQLVVNHLTRMQSGFICVAGINLATGQHVRPVVRGGGLRASLLASNGGPFEIGAVVELGRTMYVGQAPETEDYLFDLKAASRVGDVPSDEFWKLLDRYAKKKLVEIFGKELSKRGAQSCGTDVGRGAASLGCFIPAARPHARGGWRL